ncbi:hypothetical protein CcCBS67573_g04063 [Chytriomyces confervae]|uniref:AB hydrolase-1 domain-containing protein n=1 Tax=Chytriomyces confervae TaxID=246404 RepID=A0A507FH56_9FUNG|nr:hypothetical protein CcCBS67573_g04063 [Chytriomyces confervae]
MLAAETNSPCSNIQITQPAAFSSVLTIVLPSTDRDTALTEFYLGRYFPRRGYLLANMTSEVETRGLMSDDYVSLITGSHPYSDDGSNANQTTLIDLLESNSKFWRIYLESYSGNCSSLSASTTQPGSPHLANRNPLQYIPSIVENPERCQNIANKDQFDKDVADNNIADWMLYIPTFGDSETATTTVEIALWLKQFLEPLLESPHFEETLFIITFDKSRSGNGEIYTLLLGSGIASFNRVDHAPYSRHSILATVEDVFHLGNLGREDEVAAKIPLISHSLYNCQKSTLDNKVTAPTVKNVTFAVTAVGCLLSSAYTALTAIAEMRLGDESSWVHVTRTTVALPLWTDVLSVAVSVAAPTLNPTKLRNLLLFVALCSASASAFLLALSASSEGVAAGRCVVLALCSAAALTTSPKKAEETTEETPLLSSETGERIPSKTKFSIAAIATAAFLSLLMCIGTTIHYTDAQKYPAPGKMISIYENAFSIHLHCTGQPSNQFVPTILLDTGMAVTSVVAWEKMLPGLETLGARVCWYDRAGYGWSESGPLPQTAKRNSEILHEVLKTAEEKGPFILVGHSFGAWTIRLYAAAYPEQVVGLVFLEPSSEDFEVRRSELWPAVSYQSLLADMDNYSTVFSTIGMLLSPFAAADRLALAGFEEEHGGSSRTKYSPRQTAVTFKGKFFKAVSSELANFLTISANQTRASMPKTPRSNLPITVLVAQNEISAYCTPQDAQNARNCTTRNNNNNNHHESIKSENEANAMAHYSLLESFARAYSDANEFVVAMKSSHHVTVDAPEACVAAVARVLERVVRGAKGEYFAMQNAFAEWANEEAEGAGREIDLEDDIPEDEEELKYATH